MKNQVRQKLAQTHNPFYRGFFVSEELGKMGFKSVGENVKIAKSCTIIGIENISIGNNVQIDEQVFIAANRGGLEIGSHVHIGATCHLNGNGGVVISDFCGLSQGVKIYSVTNDYSGESLTNPTISEKYKKVKVAAVRLERHVLIGAGSVVFPGVSIGIGSAIGALSLVSVSLGEWGIYFGSPAKKIKVRSKKILELEERLMLEKNV